MATTRTSITADLNANACIVPARTPGSLGYCDATEPGRDGCAGDTPGPVGYGEDAGACFDTVSSEEPAVLFCIDERRVLGLMRKHAYLSAELKHAKRSGREVDLGERRVVEADQSRILAETMQEYAAARQAGGDALLAFVENLVERSNQKQADLQRMFGMAIAAGERDARMWGRLGMVVATVNLGATVTRKVVAEMTGPVGWGIDVATDVAVEGINAYGKGPDKQLMAEIAKLREELGKKGVEEFDEVVEALHKLQAGDVTEEYVESLIKRVEHLEARVERLGKVAKPMKKRRYRQAVEELKRLKPLLVRHKAALLPVRGARWLAKKGGKEVVGAVFLAADLTEAFETWYSQVQQFSTN